MSSNFSKKCLRQTHTHTEYSSSRRLPFNNGSLENTKKRHIGAVVYYDLKQKIFKNISIIFLCESAKKFVYCFMKIYIIFFLFFFSRRRRGRKYFLLFHLWGGGVFLLTIQYFLLFLFKNRKKKKKFSSSS